MLLECMCRHNKDGHASVTQSPSCQLNSKLTRREVQRLTAYLLWQRTEERTQMGSNLYASSCECVLAFVCVCMCVCACVCVCVCICVCPPGWMNSDAAESVQCPASCPFIKVEVTNYFCYGQHQCLHVRSIKSTRLHEMER